MGNTIKVYIGVEFCCLFAARAAERERDACSDAWNRLCERGHKSIEGTALTDKAGL